MLDHEERILLGNRVKDCFYVEQFLFVLINRFICYISGFVNNDPFRIGCIFLDIPFCITTFCIKLTVPTFKFVAGVNREFI